MPYSNEGFKSKRILFITEYSNREKGYYELLSNFRTISFSLQNIQQLINSIVREELQQEIDDDIELHDIIVKEIIDKWEQWQNEEFESTIQWMMETEDEQQVFCPVCERNLLSLKENIISCLCGLR